MDATKASLPDLRHRFVLHNDDFGPELVQRALPDRPFAREVAREHAREDLGAVIPLLGWVEQLRPDALPRLRPLDLDALIEDERRRARLLLHDGPRGVLALLQLPLQFAPDPRAWCVLGNAAGIALVRQVLGPARMEAGAAGGEVVFDPAECAESIVHRLFRRIPDLREIADALAPQHRLALGLDATSIAGTA